MKLWASTTSPYVRKTRIAVIEKNLQNDVEEVFIKTNALAENPDLKAANPLAKIPCLTLNNGQMISDSRVICRYFDEMGSGAILHPAGDYQHETLIAIADGMIDAAALMAYERMLRPEEMRYAPWVEGQWSKVTASLEFVDGEYMNLFEEINMANIATFSLLEYLDFRFDDRNWRQYAPRLSEFHARVQDRPSFVATRPFDK